MRTLPLLDRIAETWHIWHDRHEVRDELSALSDREPADIGLTRDDIEAVARGTYQRGPARVH
ncbi:hypothetical protein C882_3484 [Caenispirillum salinarum AK4]|uniref:YjiS-like domain-containing protein n=1 Tax=Caenispirillum salinarum AK4 TaxID=1238182 RepID=K9H3W7_9PROT|nr:DUF1127 domain-containing protein [Caenispirillum salinarum]EKV31734.1 hypothetical protein C882_3484 [Caenispirillum salinarum AK4]